MAHAIAGIESYEILDSRGNPTLRVVVELSDGTRGVASVPSGASTGRREAVERRDGDRKRFRGEGVLGAVQSIAEDIAPALIGRDAEHQAEIDGILIDLDGTPDKSRLGGNALVGVSIAVARAAANALRMPLYEYLGGAAARRLPMPMINVINGGKHADNALDFQEFLIVPLGAPSFAEALRYAVEVFHSLKDILRARGYSTGVGDEGGFAPNLRSNEEACDLIVEAIRGAGLEPGVDVAIALDPAASAFGEGGRYTLAKSSGDTKDGSGMIELFTRWTEAYPIVSIEDALSEDDWDGFAGLTARLGEWIQVVGDDIYVTNPDLIRRGVDERTTNAVLIKPNQIGTVTETIRAVELCREAGWRYVISHRSGETEDTFIADFAVAMGGGQIKAGSVCRGERTAKYNRLLEIERELGEACLFENPFAGQSRSNVSNRSADLVPTSGVSGQSVVAGTVPSRRRQRALARQEWRRMEEALTILAVLPDAGTVAACLDAAAAAATVDSYARIAALHVQVAPRALSSSDEEIALQVLRASEEGTAGERMAQARAAFDDWIRSAGSLPSLPQWRQRIGAEEPLVEEETRAVDLIVIARPDNLDGQDALHAAVFDHGHLVLLVPSSWRKGKRPLAKHIAIGWRAGEHALHAVLQSLPWLKAASRVTLIAVDQPNADMSHDEIVRLLHRECAALELVQVQSGEQSIGARLLDEARERRADCLVMGAYRHRPLYELIFGGVTDHVLKHTDLPVFLLHWTSRHG